LYYSQERKKMKTVAKCIGCGRTKLVNEFDLCKRCNRHAHDFLTHEDFERMQKQHEAILEAKAKREAKKAAAKGGPSEEAEVTEGEGEEGAGDDTGDEPEDSGDDN
jgi:hypothetical protein